LQEALGGVTFLTHTLHTDDVEKANKKS